MPRRDAWRPLDLPAHPPGSDRCWQLAEEGLNLAREHEIESLFTVANGYVGTRGSLAEGTQLSAPATYIAGVYDVSRHSGAVPALALAPDWTALCILLGSQPLEPASGEVLEHHRVLDLRQGIFWREWRQRDPFGRITRLRSLRLASLADRHLLLQSLVLTPENYGARLRIISRLQPPARDRGALADEEPVLVPDQVVMPSKETVLPVLVLRTTRTGITVAIAPISRLVAENGQVIPCRVEGGPGWLIESWEWDGQIGRTYRLDRVIVIYSTRETSRPAMAACARVQQLADAPPERMVTAHTRAWEARWQGADVEVMGDADAQLALRFAIYHLVSAANPEDDRVSVAARALTGEAYKGHVFWDTEIYTLPFYTFTWPSAARAMLLYRYHTLPAAREKARRLGYRGALYAWESADTGQEAAPSLVSLPSGETIRILVGEQEHHISADIAYAVWQYWQATADDAFFRDAGAEIILETARFWASRGQIEADGRYHIRRVIGPDEYHETVDDNAYTNVLARWNLERGADTARLLAERWPEHWRALSERLGLTPDEPPQWLELAQAMATGFHPASGLFEQFAGYFGLVELDLAAHATCTMPIDVCIGREQTRRSKAIKQADVVALLVLLWDAFPPAVRAANFHYYEPRTAHGSSLSPSFHALAAARLGEVALAERYFRQAAEIDLANNMGNAAGGIHIGALGGLWQAAVFGFGGLLSRPDGLVLDPHLPERWTALRFRVQWRGCRLLVTLRAAPAEVTVRIEGDQAVPLALGDSPMVALAPGQTHLARRGNAGWEPWRPAPAGTDVPELTGSVR